MISALEIGIALSLPLLVLAYALAPKPKPIRIVAKDGRIRNAQQRRRPNT